MPWPQRLNFFFQKHVTKGVELTDEHFLLKLQHGIDHYNFLEKYLPGSKGLKILELGTGWYPIVPLVFFLKKAGTVFSVDIQQWIRKENQLKTVEKFLELRKAGRLPKELADVDTERWKVLEGILSGSQQLTLEEINEAIGLRYMLQDARRLSFEDGSVDMVCSNNTLEHIREDQLPAMLAEFKRILKKDGLMSHFIDMSDHFAHFDTSITIYNFLKYSRKQWKRIDNNIQHLNRLRLKDFRHIYNDVQIPVTEEDFREGSLDDLAKIRVHPEFSSYTPEELAISHVYLISKMDG